MSFEKAIEFVIAQEGGLKITDDPSDPGGLTKFGISQRAYRHLDIRNLTEEDARGLYFRDYWEKCSCGSLPPSLAIVVFDCAVNQGPNAAIRILQQALGVQTDGVIGPKTLEAAQVAGSMILAELVARRATAYGLNPNFTRYGLGWSRRLAECHELALETA